MRFPDKKLVIEKNRYTENEKIVFIDKKGGIHAGTVKSVNFKGLIEGWLYGIELDEPFNGIKNYLVKEERIYGFKENDRFKRGKYDNQQS